MKNKQLLAEGLLSLGLDLSVEKQEKLIAYLNLLYKWNKTYNLTSLGVSGKGKYQSEPNEEAVSHHLLDSLSILPFIDQDTMLDVGSGGGTPGIPLSIAKPELKTVLLDSNAKKCTFLRQAVIELGLSNVSVYEGRVEQYQPAEPFSIIVSRAFSELSDFVGLSAHLLKDDGRWLAMKGVFPEEEMARLPRNIKVCAVHKLNVPHVEGARHVVALAKHASA